LIAPGSLAELSFRFSAIKSSLTNLLLRRHLFAKQVRESSSSSGLRDWTAQPSKKL